MHAEVRALMRLCILRLRLILSVATLLAASVSAADAQIYEAVGIRAQGMGGAFVAVADDATASWWNPAGVATGAYFSSVLEFDRLHQPDSDRDATGQPQPAWRAEVRTVAAAFPALALSYYRLRISEVRGPGSTATP